MFDARKIYHPLDLTLFADLNVQTTLLDSPGNDLSPEMKTYYEKQLIRNAEPNLVHDQFGVKRPIPKGGGKTIEFRRFSPLPRMLTTLTEGVTPDGQNLNVTALTATVEQYGGYVTISDLLDLTAIDRNIEEATKLLGTQAGETLDVIVRDVMAGGTNVMYAPKVAADGAETEVLLRGDLDATSQLTVKTIFRAVARLKAMNAKPMSDGRFVAIVHPNVACDLMTSKDWLEAHKYAQPENIYRGEIGMLGGVRFVESTLAKIVGGEASGGLSVYCTMVIGDNAYGVTEVEGGGLQHIVKQMGSGGTSDPLNQRATTGWKALKVAERLVEEYMVRIEHTSATGPQAESN